MLKIIRRILAAICFIAVTLLFLDFTGTLHHWLGWTAKVQFIPAVLAMNIVVVVALVLLTLVFGRIYCSVICPLGVMQDIISWIHGKRKKNRFTYSKEVKWLRYPMMVIFIALLIAGVGSVLALLEPYGTYGIIATNLLQPIYQWCNNGIAAIAEHYNSYGIYTVDVWVKSIASLVTAIVLFAVIAILAWRGGRTYCNTICPVGTLLSFVSRFSLLKVHIDDDKCIKCGMCTRNCKASCIDYKNGTIDHSRCVTCGNCIDKCHKDAIYYGRPRKGSGEYRVESGEYRVQSGEYRVESTEGRVQSGEGKVESGENSQAVDKGKRAFLIGSGVALATTAMAQAKKKVDGGLAAIEEKQMLKGIASFSEKEVSGVMIPRVDIVGIEQGMTFADMLADIDALVSHLPKLGRKVVQEGDHGIVEETQGFHGAHTLGDFGRADDVLQFVKILRHRYRCTP